MGHQGLTHRDVPDPVLGCPGQKLYARRLLTGQPEEPPSPNSGGGAGENRSAGGSAAGQCRGICPGTAGGSAGRLLCSAPHRKKQSSRHSSWQSPGQIPRHCPAALPPALRPAVPPAVSAAPLGNSASGVPLAGQSNLKQRMAGMSCDLGRDVPGSEKLYSIKLWARFFVPH